MPPACRSKYTRAPPRAHRAKRILPLRSPAGTPCRIVDDEIHFIVVFEEEGGVKHPDLLRDLVDPTPVNPAHCTGQVLSCGLRPSRPRPPLLRRSLNPSRPPLCSRIALSKSRIILVGVVPSGASVANFTRYCCAVSEGAMSAVIIIRRRERFTVFLSRKNQIEQLTDTPGSGARGAAGAIVDPTRFGRRQRNLREFSHIQARAFLPLTADQTVVPQLNRPVLSRKVYLPGANCTLLNPTT